MTIARLGHLLSPIVASQRQYAEELDSLGAYGAPSECYNNVHDCQAAVYVAHINNILERTAYTWSELVAEVADRVSHRVYREYLMEAFSCYEEHLERQETKRRRIKQMMQPWLPGGLGGMQIAEQQQKAITALAHRTAA